MSAFVRHRYEVLPQPSSWIIAPAGRFGAIVLQLATSSHPVQSSGVIWNGNVPTDRRHWVGPETETPDMKTPFKTLAAKLGLGSALAASALLAASPAEARDRYYRHHDDDAAIAIGAGVIGLAIGAAIADRSDDRYYDRGYYSERRYVRVRDRPGYYYYYEGYPNRYYQDRYYDRYYAPYYRDRWSRGRDYRYERRDYYYRGRDHRDHDRYDHHYRDHDRDRDYRRH